MADDETGQAATGGSDTAGTEAGSGGERTSRRWREDVESALDDVGAALQAAWDGSREARAEALEAARGTLSHLGTAIDQATEAARQRWEDTDSAHRGHPGAPPDEPGARTDPAPAGTTPPPPPPHDPGPGHDPTPGGPTTG
jgi:hypothetical protein